MKCENCKNYIPDINRMPIGEECNCIEKGIKTRFSKGCVECNECGKKAKQIDVIYQSVPDSYQRVYECLCGNTIEGPLFADKTPDPLPDKKV